MHEFQVSGSGPAAHFVRLLQGAGYDMTDEKAMQWGMIAYNSALLTWKVYNKEGNCSIIAPPSRTDIGRNQPCSCGSGVKYKKCCLQKSEPKATSSIFRGNHRIIFGSNIIPNMTDDESALRDMAVLSEIMDRDAQLQDVQFSTAKVSDFLLKNRPRKGKNVEVEIDDLAFRYAKESGEHRILASLNDKFLKAAEYVRNEEELRALTFGVMLAMAYQAMKDTDNLLSVLLFRKAMSKVFEPLRTTDKLIEKLGGRDAILKRLESSDFSLKEEMTEAFEELTDSEKKITTEQAKKDYETLWKSVSDKSFPVKLPFVMTLPYLVRLQQRFAQNPEMEREDFEKVMDEGTGELLDEDSKLYISILEEWLKKNEELKQSDVVGLLDRVSNKVRRKNKWLAPVRGLLAGVKTGGLELYMDGLVGSTLSTGGFVQIHEDEPEILKALDCDLMDASSLEKYADLIASLSYPALAERTRRYAGQCKGLPFLTEDERKLQQQGFEFA
jgi:SEC-C motif